MTVYSKLLERNVVTYPYSRFDGRRVAVTGGRGAIGRALIRGGLPPQGGIWTAIDLPMAYDAIGTDILDYESLVRTLHGHKADMIVHAAANKHAPEGEVHPYDVADVNVRGTQNVVDAALELGIDRLVFTSTCKAANPETVYGASKLVGERIVLNAGFTVARFYNVVESSRNVFSIWAQATLDDEPCLIMPCERYFIHLGEAVSFVLSCFDRESGRYVPYATLSEMIDIHNRWRRENAERNTGWEIDLPRRGDRLVEPAWGTHESPLGQNDHALKIVSRHD